MEQCRKVYGFDAKCKISTKTWATCFCFPLYPSMQDWLLSFFIFLIFLFLSLLSYQLFFYLGFILLFLFRFRLFSSLLALNSLFLLYLTCCFVFFLFFSSFMAPSLLLFLYLISSSYLLVQPLPYSYLNPIPSHLSSWVYIR